MARINDDDVRLPDETSISTESATTNPNETSEQKTAREAKEKKLALARKQFKTSSDSFSFWRSEAVDDTKYRAGTWGKKTFQWTEGIRAKREAEGRPCLTVNRAPTFIRQVTNQSRMAHLRIQVNPVDDHGDPKLAEVLQGMIRNVETASGADRVYATAGDKQAEIGFGCFRIVTEYIDADEAQGEQLFRQRIRMKRIRNPMRVYPDPAAEEFDFKDGEFLFFPTDVDGARYKEITGKEPPTEGQISTFKAQGDDTGDWFPNGKYRICEWFNRENKGPRERKALLASGKVIDYPTPEQEAALKDLGDPVVRDRWVQKRVLMWRKITALDILEETEWPAKGIPFYPVVGDELEIDGERDFRGVVRDAKESGRIYNVEVSALVEAVGLGQKAPVVGYRGQFGEPDSPMRKAWETANTSPRAFLEIEHIDIDGKPAPIPQRVAFEPPIGGIVEAIHQADEDYKTTAGFRDASLGERGPQESGRAIVARQRQDELGSSHYLDNERFALCSAGRDLIQLFRVIYDVPTVVRITGNDDRERKVMVYSGKDKDPRQEQYLQTHPGPQPLTVGEQQIQPGQKIPFQLPKGVTELYDLSVGEFDVEVSAGPSSGSRRQEAVEAMTNLFKGLPPEIAAKFLDLYFLMMDFPMARQMSERAKKMLPPEMQDNEDGAEPLPPAVQAKMQQAMQMVQQLGQELEAARKELAGKEAELASKERIAAAMLASKEKIAASSDRVELLTTEATLSAEKALADIRAQLEVLQTMVTNAHEQRMAAQEDVHLSTEAHRDRVHDVHLEAAAQASAAEAAAAAPPAPAIDAGQV